MKININESQKKKKKEKKTLVALEQFFIINKNRETYFRMMLKLDGNISRKKECEELVVDL